MKKSAISIVTIGLVVIVVAIVYHFYFSLSSVLNKESFSSNDILTSEKYLSEQDQTTEIFLLENRGRIGFVIANKNKYGLWGSGLTSIAEGLSDKDLITTAHGIMKMQNGEVLSESHIYVAYFIENKVNVEIKSPPNFDLKVNYFTVNDRVLLFAHGIARNKKEQFGSNEIIAYLQSQLKESHSE